MLLATEDIPTFDVRVVGDDMAGGVAVKAIPNPAPYYNPLAYRDGTSSEA